MCALVAATRSTNLGKSNDDSRPARSDSARMTSHGMPKASLTCATEPPSISVALAAKV